MEERGEHQAAMNPPLKSGESATPWVSASELQRHGGDFVQDPVDVVEEMSMESFPCSDPPCHGRSCRDEDVVPPAAVRGAA